MMSFTTPTAAHQFRTRVRSAARCAALALTLVTTAAACGDDDTSPTGPSQVTLTLSDSNVTLVRGQSDSVQVTATVAGTSNTAVTWSTGDASVATVSQTGVITAVGNGQTFVTARSQADTTRNRTVTVTVVSTTVTLSPTDSIFGFVGGPGTQVAATVANNSDSTVTWSSEDSTIATVDSTGLVTGIAAGTTTITARSVGDTTAVASISYTVDAAPPTGYGQVSSDSSITVSATAGSVQRYYLSVPSGTTELEVTLDGENGEAELFLYPGSTSAADLTNVVETGRVCTSTGEGTAQSCTVANPRAGLYYVLIRATEAFTNASLTIALTP